ncbi:MAG: APC family permease [Pseudonocardia sp.]|nr:APC family permease [Pseudonocardia sp.]MBO0875863.1 APC family permease [Pseudonocardia sp.]
MPDVLSRRLGSADAVVLGLAVMLGTGVFIVFAPAAARAGAWLPLAVVLAGAVAACNAFSTADLAARYPDPGGGHLFGRQRLAPWAGRLAGVALLAGKTASAAAAAGVFGHYVLPARPLCAAVPLIVVVGMLNAFGVRWTARGARVVVPGVLAVLAMVVLVGFVWRVSPDWSPGGLSDADTTGAAKIPIAGMPASSSAVDLGASPHPVGPLGVLTAAGLVFFAFAGYERAAGLGDEVCDLTHSLRRTIPVALLIALVTYLAVAAALLHALGVTRLGMQSAPLAAAVGGADAPALGVVVRVGAAAATVTVLLGVLAGVGRTTLAMARRHELPGWLAEVGRAGTPLRADLVGAAGAVLVAVLAGPVAAVALSACCMLVYYALINFAALRLPATARRWPAWASAVGLVLCVGLAVLLPAIEVAATAVVLALGSVATAALSRRASLRGAGSGATPAPEPGPDM